MNPGDARQHSSSFERNIEPIIAGLRTSLPDLPGLGLEVGSGSGQHALRLARAFPAWRWQPSDSDPASLASIAAWRAEAGLLNLAPPLRLDAAGDWPAGLSERPRVVFAANVIHIAPWDVSEGMIAGAGRALAPGGRLIFYGPFRESGRHTSDGNRRFDEDLRRRNPAWGIRDLEEIAALARAAGLGPARIMPMPANNRLVVFALSSG